ncbi:hypothetical protein KM043_003733 [Ampulex compressa]|nr:hypothetical protein KM043_003733 [Ampulex compressa]
MPSNSSGELDGVAERARRTIEFSLPQPQILAVSGNIIRFAFEASSGRNEGRPGGSALVLKLGASAVESLPFLLVPRRPASTLRLLEKIAGTLPSCDRRSPSHFRRSHVDVPARASPWFSEKR